MNKFLFTIALFHIFFCFTAHSQDQKWDSTYRPGAYSIKVGQFRSFQNAASDIVFLGNSITAGVDWHELLDLPQARNRGISGDISFGVLERLYEVTEGKPAKVFILIGINDISRNIPDSIIVHNYKRIIQTIKTQSPTTKIYMQTLLPVNNEFTQFKNHYNKDEHILWINDQIRQLGKQENITVIDLYPHFLNADKKLDKRYTMDGLHLNAEGYKLWASILKNGNYLK
jgi:lysophospholipase L1-like esterase